jgi:hypothetical protein
MGQLRQAHCPVGTKPTLPTLHAIMLPPLVAGFMLSSLGVFALTRLAGVALGLGAQPRMNVIVVVPLALCAIADVLFPRVRPTLFNRQTPRGLSGRYSLRVTGLLWGLDTGTVVSTFRSSAASWAALTLTFAGWAPWWIGIGYGVGFSLPLAFLVATYSPDGEGRASWRRRSTESLVTVLGGASRYVRLAAAATALVGTLLAINSTLAIS